MSRSHTVASTMLLAAALLASACAPTADGARNDTPTTVPTTGPVTVPATTARGSSTSATATTTTGEPATSAPPTDPSTTTITTIASTSTSTTSTVADEAPVSYDVLQAAALGMVEGNFAVSVSVWRDGAADFSFTAGVRADGRPITDDTPFVIASVSKLVTALSVARLAQAGLIALDEPVPWDEMGVRHDPTWNGVTVRELLAHSSGMPVARKSWLDDPGPCTIPLQQAMAAPPTETRGTWRYSNGNYCALGVLVELRAGLELDAAAYQLVFDPAGIAGPVLSTDAQSLSAAPYQKGLARLERLGGAGTWLASANDIAAMLAATTDDDLLTLQWPGIIVDQYGWGHTGTVDGAEACAWVLADGRTTVVALVSGSRPNTGGKVCDRVVPALAIDLGVYAGDPVRNPV